MLYAGQRFKIYFRNYSAAFQKYQAAASLRRKTLDTRCKTWILVVLRFMCLKMKLN